MHLKVHLALRLYLRNHLGLYVFKNWHSSVRELIDAIVRIKVAASYSAVAAPVQGAVSLSFL